MRNRRGDVIRIGRGRQDEHPHRGRTLRQGVDDLDTGGSLHGEIENQHVRRQARRERKGLIAVCGVAHDRDAGHLQNMPRRLPQQRVIVRDDDARSPRGHVHRLQRVAPTAPCLHPSGRSASSFACRRVHASTKGCGQASSCTRAPQAHAGTGRCAADVKSPHTQLLSSPARQARLLATAALLTTLLCPLGASAASAHPLHAATSLARRRTPQLSQQAAAQRRQSCLRRARRHGSRRAHGRCRARHGASAQTRLPRRSATAATATSAVLLGDASVESNRDYLPPGEAEAFPTTAALAATVNAIHVYVDTHNGARAISVGLYANRASGPCAAQTSAQGGLRSLPSSWSPGVNYATCPLSVYLSGQLAPLEPVISLEPPAGGEEISGGTTKTSTSTTSATSMTATSTTLSSSYPSSLTSTTTQSTRSTSAISSTSTSTSITTSTTSAPPAPSASFTYSPSAPAVGQVVHLNGSGSSCAAAPCAYQWSDDGSPTPPESILWPLGSGAELEYAFSEAGTKYVRLTITDALGRVASVEHDIVVSSSGTTTSTSSTTAVTSSSTSSATTSTSRTSTVTTTSSVTTTSTSSTSTAPLDCVVLPSACGYPDQSNTGVP